MLQALTWTWITILYKMEKNELGVNDTEQKWAEKKCVGEVARDVG